MTNRETKRIVVWGLLKKYHTHRHIHKAFYENAKKIGYEALWVEDELQSQKYIRPGDLIIAAEVVGKMVSEKTKPEDYYLPVRNDVFYCLHHYNHDLFTHRLEKSQYINLRFFSNEAVLSGKEEYWSPVTIFDKETQTLYQPWGTDLLSEEFLLPIYRRNRFVFWIGSIWNDTLNRGNIESIKELKDSLKRHSLHFVHLRFVPDFLNRFFIRLSRIAPAVAGKHQVKVDYLPCRVFKNISYGQLGITNVKKFKELFGDAFIEGDTIKDLVSNSLSLDEQTYKEKILAQQEVVKRYTYKNAIENIIHARKIITGTP